MLTAESILTTLTAMLTPEKPQRLPLLPLREGVWYKSRNGDFVTLRDSGDKNDTTWRMHYYRKKDEDPYDWWNIITNTGKHGSGDGHDIVAYADDDTSSAFLPLRSGVEYLARDGQKVTALSGSNYQYHGGPGEAPTIWAVDRNNGRWAGDRRELDIVGLWNDRQAPAVPGAPDVAPLLAALAALNRDVSEASIRAIAERALAASRDSIRKELTRDIATALEQPLAQIIAEQAAKQVPIRELIIKDKTETRTVESPHPALSEAIEISRAINNVWLCGPAGSGKTTLAHQLAQSLGLDYAFISCTAGMSEAKLLGRMNVQGAYLPAEFVRIYEEGGVFLWDEFDAADPNVVLCANAAMANGHLSVPDRVDRPCATRHPSTILIVATNTWGRGSTSEYTARETLDAATRDRFVLSKIAVDYAPQIEWQYLGGYDATAAKPWACPTFAISLPNVLARIRANIEKHHLRRVMSTRAFAQAAALRALGWDDRKIIERYFLDWTEQERTKALEGVA